MKPFETSQFLLSCLVTVIYGHAFCCRLYSGLSQVGPLPNAVTGRRFDLAVARLLTRPLISKVVA